MLKLLRVTPLLAVLASPAAVAATVRPAPKVAVLPFAGDDGHLRAQVIRALHARQFQVVRADDADSADELGAPAEVNVAAVIDGRVKAHGWKWVLTVHVRANPSGTKLGAFRFVGGRAQISRDVVRNFGRRADRALARAGGGNRRGRTVADAHMEPTGQPSAGARPANHSSADDVADEPLAPRGSSGGDNDGESDEDTSDDSEVRDSLHGPEVELRQSEPERSALAAQSLDFSLGMHLFTRHFRYLDPVGTLTPYRLLWAPAPAATLEWFPFDLIGLTGSGQIETGATTTDRDGTAFPTSHWSFLAGLKVRYPVGPVWLSTAAEYGVDTFRIDNADPDTPKPPVPSVRYEFARAELALLARPTSYLTFQLTGGYRYVFSAGEIESTAYFPHASVDAYDASATLAVRLRRGMELRIAADFRRYQFQMRSQSSDLRMARAAVDDYVGGTVSLAVLVGGRRGF